MLNLTVDDTNAAALSYGPGWGVASSDDAALSKYFQSTYHASETAGALFNFTFSGLAVYLYGSKGPGHGNFSVRYDSKIEFLSANSNKPRYQQLLFSGSFDSDADPHSFTLNNTSGKWLDLDFLIITNKDPPGTNQTQGSSSESTISPLPVPSRSSDGSQTRNTAGSQETPNGRSTVSPASPTAASSVQSQSSSNDTTLILATVFGTLLFLLILGIATYFIVRRLRKSRPVSAPSSHNAPSAAGSVFLIGQPSPSFSYDKKFLPASATQPTATPADNSPNLNLVAPFREIAPEPDVPESTKEQTSGRNSAAARPWSPLRTSPIKALFGGGVKDGEDSMKSTFLKV